MQEDAQTLSEIGCVAPRKWDDEQPELSDLSPRASAEEIQGIIGRGDKRHTGCRDEGKDGQDPDVVSIISSYAVPAELCNETGCQELIGAVEEGEEDEDGVKARRKEEKKGSRPIAKRQSKPHQVTLSPARSKDRCGQSHDYRYEHTRPARTPFYLSHHAQGD